MGDAERGGPPATQRRTHSAEMLCPSLASPLSTYGYLAECGSLADIWRLELRPLAGKGVGLPMASGAAQPCRCRLSGQPACSLGPEIEENSAEAPEVGPVVQCCIELFARGRGHRASSWHSCGSFGHKFGTTAPTHLGMPLSDYRFARRTARGAATQNAFASETSAGAVFVPGLQWPHRRLANALWAAMRPSGTHRVLARDSRGHYRPNLGTVGGDGVRRQSEFR